MLFMRVVSYFFPFSFLYMSLSLCVQPSVVRKRLVDTALSVCSHLGYAGIPAWLPHSEWDLDEERQVPHLFISVDLKVRPGKCSDG